MAYYDKKFKGLGRIKKVYGSDNEDVQNGIRVMMKELYGDGKWDFLESARDGKLTLLELYTAWKNNTLTALPNAKSLILFREIVFNWVESYDNISTSTLHSYINAFNQLLKMSPNMTLSDIPETLKSYRTHCQKKKTHRQFNVCRNALRSFLKDTQTQFDPLYQGVVAVKPLRESPKQENEAHSVSYIRECMSKMRQDIAQQFWTMCITGAGLTEYEAGLHVIGNKIHIPGTKMAHKDNRRNRYVPLIEIPAKCVLAVKQFRHHLTQASNGTVSPYDGRRCYAYWMLNAGVPFHRVQQYMGHSPKSMTERYARSAVENHMVGDAELMKQYIFEEYPNYL